MKTQGQLLIVWFVVLLFSTPNSFGQTTTQTQTPPATPTPYNPSVPSHTAGANDYETMRRSRTIADSRMLEAEMRRRALKNRSAGMALPIVLTEEELTAEERKVLEPAPEDRKKHAEFLRQSGAGIFRLMRVEKDKHRRVVSADKTDITGDVLLFGGGANYSFTKKNHNADKWSDIAWDTETFQAAVGGDALGALVDLGDTRLEELTIESNGLSYLTALLPADTASAAEQQFHQLEKGVQENGFSYSLAAPWKLETTYALRSVNYGRADVLVAFRVVRQDQNGSLIVLWKKLKNYSTPKLKKEQK